MRALVTGANGFIGSHLVEHLHDCGKTPVAMVRESSNLRHLEGSPAELRYATLREPDSLAAAMEGCDAVFHVAGLTAAFSEQTLQDVNAQGTANVLAAAQRAGVQRVVYVSSLEAAGASTHDRPRTEGQVPAPFTRYGRSKLGGEHAAWSARGELDVVIVRPPLVYGPRDVDVLQMIRSSNWRIVARPGFRNYWMSAIHVQDLVRGIVLAADRGRPLPQHSTNHVLDPSAETGSTALSGQGIYFLDDGDRHTIASFGQDAATALGKRALTVPIPWPIAWLAGLGSELVGRLRGVCPAYNLDKARASFSSGWWCSAGQAQLELGYEAQVPLSEGLPRTIHWYKENGLL